MILKIIKGTIIFIVLMGNNLFAVIHNQFFEILRSGDIIFRKENSFLSNRFEKLDGRGFSHIGLIYKNKKGVFVFHIERTDDKKDLRLDPINSFLKEASKYSIKRIKSFTLSKSNSYMDAYLVSHPTFDMKFSLETNDKLYCTELVYKFFKNNYKIILTSEIKKFGFYDYISVGSILDSPFLKSIYNYSK